MPVERPGAGDMPPYGGATIFERGRRWSALDPDWTALIDAPDGRHSIEKLLQDAEALTAAFQHAGLRPGDVISFQTPNWHEAAVIDLAAAAGGFVINPIVPIYRDAEVGFMLRDSRSKLFFFAEHFRGYDYAAMVERLLPDLPDLVAAIPVRPDSAQGSDYQAWLNRGRLLGPDLPTVDANAVKLLLYTSGTTGRPKAVLHSHNSLARAMGFSSDWWKVAPREKILMPSPVTHISGYANGLELPFFAGTCSILMENWDAAQAVSLIEEHGVSGTIAATPFLRELALAAEAQDRSLPTLRFFACGGAAVPPETIRHANAQFGRTVAFRAYGSSEAPLVTPGIGDSDPGEVAASSDGRVADYEVRTVDGSGNVLPPGEEGELLVRGPALFLGYANPEDNADAFDAEGFFRTGDVGIVTADGILTITGRKKDLIIRGGENISAKEIEDALHRHPAIREAAVVAMPHERLGEGICAVAIPEDQPGATLAKLTAFLAEQGLARQKCPERLVWVRSLPVTPSGKVRKDLLRQMAAQEHGFADIAYPSS